MRLGNALGKGHFHNRTIGFKANLIHILGRRVALDVNLFIAREFNWARKGNPGVVESNTSLISMTPVFKHTSEFGSIIGWQINQIRICNVSENFSHEIMASSFAKECTPLKHKYDNCFNDWYANKYGPYIDPVNPGF